MGQPGTTVPLFQVDAFTTEPFRGNPAAVCLLREPAGEEWMQGLAAEMNLSETAYVVPRGDEFDLRWFTPSVEVDLCGHATLASAHVLLEQELVAAGERIAFHTRSGVLTARGTPGRIELDFPAYEVEPASAPDGLADALGAPIVAFASASDGKYLVAELADEATVRGLRPDHRALGACVGWVSVTAAADAGGDHDFVSRYFAPAVGIDEDPVTGSAHCVLGPYWAERLGKTELTGQQVSLRGGVVHIELTGGRALLTGDAVTVLRGSVDV